MRGFLAVLFMNTLQVVKQVNEVIATQRQASGEALALLYSLLNQLDELETEKATIEFEISQLKTQISKLNSLLGTAENG